MAMRSAIGAIPRLSRSAAITGPAACRSSRPFSDGKGRVLSEEERAKESVYIQKMEKERMEKMKQKAEKEKAEPEKKSEDTHKG